MLICFDINSLALRTIRHPTVSVVDASTILNDLNALSRASSSLSYEIYKLLDHSRSFFDNLTPIEKLYSLSKIRPLLRRNADAVKYKAVTSGCSSSSASEIQTCPATEKAALLPVHSQASGMSIGELSVSDEGLSLDPYVGSCRV